MTTDRERRITDSFQPDLYQLVVHQFADSLNVRLQIQLYNDKPALGPIMFNKAAARRLGQLLVDWGNAK